MYSFFNRVFPSISIFHNPNSALSNRILATLRASQTGPYPSGSGSTKPPLEFNLDVVESPPTLDQLKTISEYTRKDDPSIFLSAHPSAPSLSESPKSLSRIVEMAKKNPNAFKWPVVVNWDQGQASIGDADGVKEMLEVLRKKRDGE